MAKSEGFVATIGGDVFKVIQDPNGEWYDKSGKYDIAFMEVTEYRWIYPELFKSKKEAKKVAKCLRWAGEYIKDKFEKIYSSKVR